MTPGIGGASRSALSQELRIDDRRIENRHLLVELGDNGTIVRLVDKKSGRDFADPSRSPFTRKGMNNLALQPDHGDLWLPYRGPVNGSLLYAAPLRDPMPPSGIEMQREGGAAFRSADADAVWWPDIRVVECGPLRAAIEVRYRVPRVVTRVALGSDDRMLRIRTRFLPEGKRYRLRALFPTSIRSGRIRCSIPFGSVERGEGEFAAQGWMDYADDEGGICLLNRGLPGNNVTDGVMMLSLFRAVAMEDADPCPWFEEGVEQVFDYALRPFRCGDKDYRPARLAAEFNRPLYATAISAGERPSRMDPVVSMDSDTVEMTCFRRVGDRYEIRLYESVGKAGQVTLTLARPPEDCVRTDCTGAVVPGDPPRVAGRSIVLRVRAFEIVTLRLRFA